MEKRKEWEEENWRWVRVTTSDRMCGATGEKAIFKETPSALAGGTEGRKN